MKFIIAGTVIWLIFTSLAVMKLKEDSKDSQLRIKCLEYGKVYVRDGFCAAMELIKE